MTRPARPELFVLRHGETVWNREGRMQGALDSPLTPRGRVQAARQGAILRAARTDASVFVSPRGRARATAALAGLAAREDARLAEIDMGDWQGARLADLPARPGIGWKFEAPGGEDRAALEARVDALLADLPGRAVLVTHGVFSIVLRARWLGLADWDALDDPQGVVFHLSANTERLL